MDTDSQRGNAGPKAEGINRVFRDFINRKEHKGA